MAIIRFSPLRRFFSRSLSATIAAAKPGDEIVLEAGTYTEALIIDKPLTLSGAGAPGDVVLTAAVTIRAAAGAVIVRRLTVANREGPGLVASGTAELRVSNAVLRNCGGYGIELTGVSTVLIESTRLEDNAEAGVMAMSSEGVIRNCRLFRNRSSSIIVSNFAKLAVEACEFSESAKNCIYFKEKSSGSVTNCKFGANASEYPPVAIDERSDVVVQDCDFRNLGARGIWVSDSSLVAIKSCEFANCAAVALGLSNKARASVETCRFGPLTSIAVEASEGAEAILDNCRFEQCTGEEGCIVVESGASLTMRKSSIKDCVWTVLAKEQAFVSIEDCQILDCFLGPKSSDAKTRCEITATKIEGTEANAILAFMGGRVEIRRCEIAGGKEAKFPSVISMGGELSAQDCTIDGGAQVALEASQGGRIVARECQIVRHTGNAVEATGENSTISLSGGSVEGSAEAVFVGASAKVEIDGIELKSAGDRGVVRAHGGNVEIRNCRIEDAPTHALWAQDGAQVRLENTMIGPTAKTAIWLLSQGSVLEAANSTIRGSAEAGVIATAGARLALDGVALLDIATSSLFVNDAATGRLTNCSIVGSGNSAIYVAGGASCDVVGGRIEGAPRDYAAILVEGGELNLSECVLENNLGRGVVATEGGKANIADCTFKGCGEDGVTAKGEGVKIEVARCKFESGGNSAIYATTSADLLAAYCEIEGGASEYPEIAVVKNAVAVLVGCTIARSPSGDLRVLTEALLEATDCVFSDSAKESVDVNASVAKLVNCRITAPAGKAASVANNGSLRLENVEIHGGSDEECAVLAEGFAELTLQGTLIGSAAGSGVLARGGARIVASGSSVVDAGKCGFHVEGEGTELNASACGLHGAREDGARIIAGAKAQLLNCDISAAGEIAVRASAVHVLITDTMLRDLAGAGLIVDAGANAKVDDCRFERIGGEALAASGAGAEISLERSWVFSSGPVVIAAREGALVAPRRCHVEALQGLAVVAEAGGAASLIDSIVTGRGGAVVKVSSGARLDLDGCSIIQPMHDNLEVNDSADIHVEGASTRATIGHTRFSGGDGSRVNAVDGGALSVVGCQFVGARPDATVIAFDDAAGEVVACEICDTAATAIAARGASQVVVKGAKIWNRWGARPAIFAEEPARVVLLDRCWAPGEESLLAQGAAINAADCDFGHRPPAGFHPLGKESAVATLLTNLRRPFVPASAMTGLRRLAALLASAPRGGDNAPGLLVVTGADPLTRETAARAAASVYVAYGMLQTGHVVTDDTAFKLAEPEAWAQSLVTRGGEGGILLDDSIVGRLDSRFLEALADLLVAGPAKAVLIVSACKDVSGSMIALAPRFASLTLRRLAC